MRSARRLRREVWARRFGLDARVHELAVRESRRIVRRKRNVLITETKHGFVCANSGVDVSNVDGGQHAVLLPVNPDRSAARLRRELKKELGIDIAVIVSDSFGRPWREGLTEVAIGVAGMRPLVDYRGRRDPHGYSLHATVDAVADELACAAGLVCGKLAGTPACIIRGYAYQRAETVAARRLDPAREERSFSIVSTGECYGMASFRTRAISLADLGRDRTASFRADSQRPGACAGKSRTERALTDEERYALANCDGNETCSPLLVAADTLRRDLVGNIVSYVVNRNINFTNICFVGCKFCAFSRGPREADSYFHSLEDMARKAEEAWELGATEVCIQGGLPHGLPPFYYRDILRAVKNAVPGMHIHAFSPMEIVYGVELTGMTLRDYLTMLRDNGLDTLPGTAAEILDDEMRHVLSRNKLSSAQWQEVIRTAHACGIRSTSTLMYGHRGNARPLGAAVESVPADSVRDRRLHRVRAAGLRAPEHASVPAGTGAHRADAGRAPQDSRARQNSAGGFDS